MDGGTAAGVTNNSSTFVTSVLPIVTALLGGVSVALFTYFITRKKTKAEVKKLEAETEEIRLRINNVSNITGTLGYKASSTEARVIYDSTQDGIGFGFPKGSGEYIWTRVNGKDVHVSGKGEGSLAIDDDGKVMTIRRTNTDGRFEVWLIRYQYDGENIKHIPKESNISQRIFRLSFEARAVDAQFKLKFVFKNEDTNTWAATAEREVTEEIWSKFDLYFPVAPTEKCRLRIDNVGVSKVPGYLQIRNVVLTEKSS